MLPAPKPEICMPYNIQIMYGSKKDTSESLETQTYVEMQSYFIVVCTVN